jgi:hypothetical protein
MTALSSFLMKALSDHTPYAPMQDAELQNAGVRAGIYGDALLVAACDVAGGAPAAGAGAEMVGGTDKLGGNPGAVSPGVARCMRIVGIVGKPTCCPATATTTASRNSSARTLLITWPPSTTAAPPPAICSGWWWWRRRFWWRTGVDGDGGSIGSGSSSGNTGGSGPDGHARRVRKVRRWHCPAPRAIGAPSRARLGTGPPLLWGGPFSLRRLGHAHVARDALADKIDGAPFCRLGGIIHRVHGRWRVWRANSGRNTYHLVKHQRHMPRHAIRLIPECSSHVFLQSAPLTCDIMQSKRGESIQ